RFPVTLYKEQWTKLLDMAADIRAFLTEHDAELKTKEPRRNRASRRVRGLAAAAPPNGPIARGALRRTRAPRGSARRLDGGRSRSSAALSSRESERRQECRLGAPARRGTRCSPGRGPREAPPASPPPSAGTPEDTPLGASPPRRAAPLRSPALPRPRRRRPARLDGSAVRPSS